MESDEEIIDSPTNPQSIISLVLGFFTILFFCMGWMPIPFSGFICFPISILLGILALLIGLISLNRIRKHNHSGRPMAWMGIMIGGFVFVCMLCMVILVVSFIIFAPDQVRPLLDKYQI